MQPLLYVKIIWEALKKNCILIKLRPEFWKYSKLLLIYFKRHITVNNMHQAPHFDKLLLKLLQFSG